MAIVKKLKYSWDDLSRRDKTDILTVAMMRHIFINSHNLKIGMREVNVNIGKNKPNLRIDVLEINRKKNELVGYEVKSCIQDFRTDKKWDKYLTLINQLYFVFDKDTFEKHQTEILEKIGNNAGIYTYNPTLGWVSLVKGVKFTQLDEKQEVFYRTILFNYLFRHASRQMQKREMEE